MLDFFFDYDYKLNIFPVFNFRLDKKKMLALGWKNWWIFFTFFSSKFWQCVNCRGINCLIKTITDGLLIVYWSHISFNWPIRYLIVSALVDLLCPSCIKSELKYIFVLILLYFYWKLDFGLVTEYVCTVQLLLLREHKKNTFPLRCCVLFLWAVSCRRRRCGGRASSRSVRAGCRSCRGWRTVWLWTWLVRTSASDSSSAHTRCHTWFTHSPTHVTNTPRAHRDVMWPLLLFQRFQTELSIGHQILHSVITEALHLLQKGEVEDRWESQTVRNCLEPNKRGSLSLSLTHTHTHTHTN